MPPVSLQNAYQGAVRCEYAVRGRVVAKAMELEAQGRKIYFCNIGNPQSFHQQPITFARQVLALCSYPALFSSPSFPSDAKSRAQTYLDGMAGRSSGSYSHSAGVLAIRKDVANFITRRDQCDVECNPENLFLTDGAGPGAQMLIRMLIRGPQDGIMIPVPRYPLYSALADLVNGTRVDYFLDESKGWQFTRSELESQLQSAKAKGVSVRALVVVNPGNPTGQVLDLPAQQAVVKFCAENDLVLIADEVYQENIWHPHKKFTSFRKVALDLNLGDQLELVSLHSISKGFFGECGRRGGYLELSPSFKKEVKDTLYKMASVNLCSNVDGQIVMGVMCNPPLPHEPSFLVYSMEKELIMDSLKRKAKMVGDMLNTKASHMQCVVPEGALYAFPQVELPLKYQQLHATPDEAYCLELLEETGIVVVPGSGFGQREGTFHFRTTILPDEEELPSVLGKLLDFHQNLWRTYG